MSKKWAKKSKKEKEKEKDKIFFFNSPILGNTIYTKYTFVATHPSRFDFQFIVFLPWFLLLPIIEDSRAIIIGFVENIFLSINGFAIFPNFFNCKFFVPEEWKYYIILNRSAHTKSNIKCEIYRKIKFINFDVPWT